MFSDATVRVKYDDGGFWDHVPLSAVRLINEAVDAILQSHVGHPSQFLDTFVRMLQEYSYHHYLQKTQNMRTRSTGERVAFLNGLRRVDCDWTRVVPRAPGAPGAHCLTLIDRA